MKKLKKLIILFTAALFCMLAVLSQPLTAQASEPTTYYLKYIDSIDQWRFLKNVTTWDDTAFSRELYYMQLDLKDGDTIVIDSPNSIDLTVNVNLKNLTVLNSTMAIVKAKSFDEVYVLNGSAASISGDVANGYVYDACTANFNNNIKTLYAEGCCTINVVGNAGSVLAYDPVNPEANLACLGTVDYFKTYDDDYVYYEYYNFAANTLKTSLGTLQTDPSKYSTTAPAATAAPSAPAANTTTNTTTSASDDELDDVPKTGDFSVSPLWFLGIAVVCMLGYCKLERR